MRTDESAYRVASLTSRRFRPINRCGGAACHIGAAVADVSSPIVASCLLWRATPVCRPPAVVSLSRAHHLPRTRRWRARCARCPAGLQAA